MEHYCIECDGHFDENRFDHTIGLCKRCAKPHRKRRKTIDQILAHYSDVCVGDLMWWYNKPAVVLRTTPNGWVVKDIEKGTVRAITVNVFDVYENFILLFRRFGDDNETDKN